MSKAWPFSSICASKQAELVCCYRLPCRFQALVHFETLYYGNTQGGKNVAVSATNVRVPDRSQAVANTLTWLVVSHLAAKQEDLRCALGLSGATDLMNHGDPQPTRLEALLHDAFQESSLFRSAFEHLAAQLELVESDSLGLTFALYVN